jgi:NAD(P)-dependent dehydrogenase (short-subunit alcohol dehydrogenase family)
MNEKKKALITGSSRGIGRAIALSLARDGFHVIIHAASNLEKAKEVQAQVIADGGTADVICSNLCDIEATKALFDRIGSLDVLVLNASLQIRRPWAEIPCSEMYDQLNCNFISSVLLIQATVPHMKAQGWGRIVTVGSVQEAKPHPDMLIYSASKAAQTNMVQSLSLQLAKDGITVNNVAPGVIYTDRNVEALSDPEYAKKVCDSIPVGFYGEPQDCAGIVSLLCSDAGRYITGQSIYVDGGKSL